MAKKLKVLLTAGPTHEPIDPVRFIGNHSTGKMGIAIADAFAQSGHQVHLVLGPTHLRAEEKSVDIIPITTAQEMYEAAMQHFPACDVAVLSAAVADWTPVTYSQLKQKKTLHEGNWQLELKKTTDILATLGAMKRENEQLLVGFSLETHDALRFAKEKRKRKNCDYIIANSLEDEGAGFGHDTNHVYLIDHQDQVEDWGLMPKKAIATRLVYLIESNFSA